MMAEKLRLRLDADRMTVDDLVAIEEGTKTARQVRAFISRFVVDANGEYIDPKEAEALVGRLSLAQLRDIGPELRDQVGAMMTNAVPPDSAAS